MKELNVTDLYNKYYLNTINSYWRYLVTNSKNNCELIEVNNKLTAIIIENASTSNSEILATVLSQLRDELMLSSEQIDFAFSLLNKIFELPNLKSDLSSTQLNNKERIYNFNLYIRETEMPKFNPDSQWIKFLRYLFKFKFVYEFYQDFVEPSYQQMFLNNIKAESKKFKDLGLYIISENFDEQIESCISKLNGAGIKEPMAENAYKRNRLIVLFYLLKECGVKFSEGNRNLNIKPLAELLRYLLQEDLSIKAVKTYDYTLAKQVINFKEMSEDRKQVLFEEIMPLLKNLQLNKIAQRIENDFTNS